MERPVTTAAGADRPYAVAGATRAQVSAADSHAPAPAQMESALPAQLPALREDLRLLEAAANRDGSPAWMVHDPIGNRFFRIGWLEFALLSRWSEGTPQALLAAVRRDTPLDVTEDELLHVLVFLAQQQLLRASDAAASTRLAALREARQSRGWKWLLHNYLFIRAPLWRPGRFLRATMPYVAPLFSRAFVGLVAVLTLAGLVLASRQWDTFLATFQDKLSFEGLAGYMIALAVTKSLHELGHAYTATRYGVRVAHMGVALLVMWPVLYTDTSESWKLADRRQRLHIAGAGILVETMIAGLATLAWSLTENPAAKSAFYFLATTSWFISLTLNASPFMRFDGYYLLSDALDLPNLHERAGALAKTQLRRTLLAWNDPDPEQFDRPLRNFLVAFSWLTWAYRFTVFLGIATAVYYFFFKLLGIVLFAVEISWFVVMPIWREAKVWIRRGGIKTARLLGWLVALLAAASLFILVSGNTVRAPSWAHSVVQHTVYSPMGAQVIEAPARNGPIQAGQILYVLDVPEIRNKEVRSDAAAQALSAQIAGLQGEKDGEEKRGVLARQLAREQAEGASQRAEIRRLVLRAPENGILVDVDQDVRAGVWVSPRQPLGTAIDAGAWLVDAFIQQQDLRTVRVGNAASFYPARDASAPLPGRVVAIDTARTLYLPNPMLDTEHGGQIVARTVRAGQAMPRDALYRVQIALDAPPPWRYARVGTAVIDVKRTSWMPQWVNDLIVVLIRETGF
jgi:putative peptide zinc metalloprotease protein